MSDAKTTAAAALAACKLEAAAALATDRAARLAEFDKQLDHKTRYVIVHTLYHVCSHVVTHTYFNANGCSYNSTSLWYCSQCYCTHGNAM
jgi:hypothetical protein